MNLLQNVVSDNNIHQIMEMLLGLKHPEYAYDFIEMTLGMLAAIDNGEPIFQFGGNYLDKQECQELKQRLSCVAKYMCGE